MNSMNNKMIRDFYSGEYDKTTIKEFREMFELEQCIDNLKSLAEKLGGTLENDESGPYIRIDTGDNTSKENFDNLIEIVSELPNIDGYKIRDYWADHDTQIIEFSKNNHKKENDMSNKSKSSKCATQSESIDITTSEPRRMVPVEIMQASNMLGYNDDGNLCQLWFCRNTGRKEWRKIGHISEIEL